MTAQTLRDSNAEPAGISIPLRALWRSVHGDWEGAHQLVQDDSSRQAAWVHAYLHRREGDGGNAQYWYSRAGRPEASGEFDAEWEQIAAVLLGA